MKAANILITGGCGFIGSALLARLLPNNSVRVLDNGIRRTPLFDELAGHPNLALTEGDILDRDAVRRAIEDATIIVHMAAIAGVSSYYKAPLRTMQVNLLGTNNMLDAALELGSRLQRFVYVSTSEVFGPVAWRARETDPTQQGDLDDRRWTYGISKLAAEKLAMCFYWEHSLPVVSLRPFNVYGPGQVGEGAVQAFVSRAVDNEPLEVTGDGLQVRAWCYIDDMVSAVGAVLESDKAVGRTYNIGNPSTAITTLGLAQRVRDLTGSASSIGLVPHQGTDIDIRVPDISRARQDLGFEPKVGLDDGLRRTVDWFRSTRLSSERAAARQG